MEDRLIDKWTEPQRNLDHHHAHQYIYNRIPEGEEREKNKVVFEEIMTKNFPNWVKDNLQIPEAEQTPIKSTKRNPFQSTLQSTFW